MYASCKCGDFVLLDIDDAVWAVWMLHVGVVYCKWVWFSVVCKTASRRVFFLVVGTGGGGGLRRSPMYLVLVQ